MKYGFEVNVAREGAPAEWHKVRPSNSATPYDWPTREEAEFMMRICYPNEHAHLARIWSE